MRRLVGSLVVITVPPCPSAATQPAAQGEEGFNKAPIPYEDVRLRP